MYFKTLLFLFCVMYSSCPKEFKHMIKKKSANIFSLVRCLVCSTYGDYLKNDATTNDKCWWNCMTSGQHQKMSKTCLQHSQLSLMVDSVTGLGTDGVYKTKFSCIKPVCLQLQEWKSGRNEVDILC